MTPSYVVAALLRCGLTIWATSTIVFFLPYVTLGRDPRTARAYGLVAEQGIWQQYLRFLGDAARLDFGPARIAPPARVAEVIALFLPWTIGLLTVATLLAFGLGLLAGGALAWRSAPGALRRLASLLVPLAAVPAYLLSLILLDIVAFRLRLAPLSSAMPTGALPALTPAYLAGMLHHALLPALAIVLSAAGAWAIATRGTMIGLIGEDFIALAEAKGLRRRRIFFVYGLRNALLPQATSLGLALGQALSGTLLVEMVFGYPGIGTLLYRAVTAFDYNTLYGIVVITGAAIGLATLILDLLYSRLDPRIRPRRA